MRLREFLSLRVFVFNIIMYNVHKIYNNKITNTDTTLVHLVHSLGNVR